MGFANGYPFLSEETARPGETGEYVYEWNHGQKMINHFTKSVIESAKRKIALNVHEPIKPTGLRRTFPNMMTREESGVKNTMHGLMAMILSIQLFCHLLGCWVGQWILLEFLMCGSRVKTIHQE